MVKVIIRHALYILEDANILKISRNLKINIITIANIILYVIQNKTVIFSIQNSVIVTK